MRDLMDNTDSTGTIEEMESLRLNKPDPTRLSIEDIHKLMMRRKFQVRPPYQRGEVINLPKATSIIESILLGIALPVIFVFKRANGVSEVIDGQQRLLTILGFIQAEYMDELGESVRTRNHGFKLRNMRILPEFKGLAYHELPEHAQDRIMDFQLFVVTIEERLNPAFDPVDLFIRLNDKPYPIKEHSFEMWNSWVDKDVITAIRKLHNKNRGWLYVRVPTQRNFRDRMENEEALAIVSFLSARKNTADLASDLDIYQKDQRLNVRVKGKRNVTSALVRASESQDGKQQVLAGIKETKSFIRKLKLILLDRDIADEAELDTYLESRFNELCHPEKDTVVRRAFQDFYVLWLSLSETTLEMVQFNRSKLFGEIQELFRLFRNVPDGVPDGVKAFMEKVDDLRNRYHTDSRRTTLSADEKAAMIASQGNQCSITGAPIFVGDEVHVDHEVPLAKGGRDEKSNLGIAHPNANQTKGSSMPPDQSGG